MDSFDSYLLRKLYKETAQHGDKLADIEKLVNWKAFTPIIQPIYNNQDPCAEDALTWTPCLW